MLLTLSPPRSDCVKERNSFLSSGNSTPWLAHLSNTHKISLDYKVIYCTTARQNMAQVFAKRCERGQTTQIPHMYDLSVQNSLRSHPIGYVVNSHQIWEWFRFRDEVKNFEPLIDSLEHAFSNSVFCCGGNVRIQDEDVEDFILKVKPKSDSENEEEWKEFSLNNILPEELLKYSNPSQFGDLRKMKTVFDPEVRLAHEIETDRFDFGYVSKGSTDRFVQSDLLPGNFSIDYHIEEELVPGRRICLKRNKLGIYGKDGFFKSHVDTPSHKNMIGTLIVCLSSPHKGGELVIRHDGHEHVFDFSKLSNDSSIFQWAAFYGDCIHEVAPVAEGFRVAITYSILCEERSLKEVYCSTDEQAIKEHFEISAKCQLRSFAKVDCSLENLPRQLDSKTPEKVGFLLKHKYTLPGLQPNMLKGEDKGLFDYLVDKGWKCQLKTTLSRFMTTTVSVDIEDMDYEETHEIYEFKPYSESISSWIPEWSDRFSGWRNPFRGFREWRVGIPFIEIYRKPDESKLVRNNEGRSQWVGNEMHDVDVDKIYLDSALIVELACKK